jgi:hypothetical protein
MMADGRGSDSRIDADKEHTNSRSDAITQFRFTIHNSQRELLASLCKL